MERGRRNLRIVRCCVRVENGKLVLLELIECCTLFVCSLRCQGASLCLFRTWLVTLLQAWQLQRECPCPAAHSSHVYFIIDVHPTQ
jgi:hypothetical protein